MDNENILVMIEFIKDAEQLIKLAALHIPAK